MSSDSVKLLDSQCSVCGAQVRGELVLWKAVRDELVSEELIDRVLKAAIAEKGGHVCGTCGFVLCSTKHKNAVANVTFLSGYRDSPCPGCGNALMDGFTIAEVPEGTFEPPPAEPSTPIETSTPAESSTSCDPAPAEAAEPEPPSIASIQWRTQPVKDGAVAFACPHCDEPHTFPAGLFQDPPPEGVEGFTGTNYSVNRQALATLLSLATAVAVFVWVYKAMFGSELFPGVQLFVPALATVLAYSMIINPLIKPVFAAMPLIASKKLPVYGYACSECGAETHVASDGKHMALPIEAQTPEETQ